MGKVHKLKRWKGVGLKGFVGGKFTERSQWNEWSKENWEMLEEVGSAEQCITGPVRF